MTGADLADVTRPRIVWQGAAAAAARPLPSRCGDCGHRGAHTLACPRRDAVVCLPAPGEPTIETGAHP